MAKLYLLDCGRLHRMLDVPARAILNQNWTSYAGYVAENFAAVELRAAGIGNLFTWTGKAAEVEFVFQTEWGVVPVEIKTELHLQLICVYLDCRLKQ